ncbi:protein AMBP [Latimeria chalumnae]|uniref:Protein AMBP n=1 Tax=Latimeria chalumnae TaxID=7897 RepID=H3A1N2_LATCH|nr:PREDICTED: protein AMBP [Latimeria chalumnae]|eukprot:XP_005994505.1 PREDICTED: protein AMBP [Latimeria chalumnae]
MKLHIAILFAICLKAVHGSPLRDEDIQVQENFDLPRIYGKWYEIAIASTCPWVKNHKDKMFMGTMVLQEGEQSDRISTTSTRIRDGTCSQITGYYTLTTTPGKFAYHNSKWNLDVNSYVVHTNYDEYSIVMMQKYKSSNSTTTVRLYGRTQELRDSLHAEFKKFALDQGIDEDSIYILPKRDECVPGEPKAESLMARARRAVLEEEEGSGATSFSLKIHKEDVCKLNSAVGPCLGYTPRYFYNSSLMACEQFAYGGCLGNGNNFHSEKECLQKCRNEAACRLPIVPGPCKGSINLWAFDAKTGKCLIFQYGGCQGNGNKFYTQKECEEYCGIPLEGDEEFLGLPKVGSSA